MDRAQMHAEPLRFVGFKEQSHLHSTHLTACCPAKAKIMSPMLDLGVKQSKEQQRREQSSSCQAVSQGRFLFAAPPSTPTSPSHYPELHLSVAKRTRRWVVVGGSGRKVGKCPFVTVLRLPVQFMWLAQGIRDIYVTWWF